METQKLTKKARKAAAFRERKGKRPETVLDVPEADIQLDDEPHPPIADDPAQKKRKRDEDGEVVAATPSQKRPKKAKDTTSTEGAEGAEGTEGKAKKKQRYILFVGESVS